MGIDRTTLKTNAKQTMKDKKPGIYLVATAYVAITLVLSLLYSYLTGMNEIVNEMYQYVTNGTDLALDSLIPVITPTAGILTVAVLIMEVMMQVGYISYCLNASRNLDAKLKDIFNSFAFFLKVLWMTILQSVFIFLWSLLLIVPGIIAAYRYRLSFYIMFDNPDMRALDCIRKSKALMAGKKLELFVLDLSFIGWEFLASLVQSYIVLPVVNIWLAPYKGITYANFYNALIAAEPVTAGTPAWEYPA